MILDDAVHGSHWDFYSYDAVSGRLESVLDVWTGEVNSFVWNAEGTLARWEANQANGYARVFGYDEEGRLVRIERDYGGGTLQLAYEYGYNGDGARVWKQDVLSQQEYRYVCGIGCGGVPMRVYNRAMGTESWNTLEEYVETPTVRWYGTGNEFGGDFPMLAGHWLSSLMPPPTGVMLYQDAFGLRIGGNVGTAAVPKRVPEYLQFHPDDPAAYLSITAYSQAAQSNGDPCEEAAKKKKYVVCGSGRCCGTDVETDIATCCPDGRAYCGSVEGYSVVCGGSKPNPTPQPQPNPRPQPPFDWGRCVSCLINCMLADPRDRSLGECWKKCVEKGDCGIRLGGGLSANLAGSGIFIGYSQTF